MPETLVAFSMLSAMSGYRAANLAQKFSITSLFQAPAIAVRRLRALFLFLLVRATVA